MSVSLPMTFAAEAHRVEGRFRRFKSTLNTGNKRKCLKFRSGTRGPTVSKRVGQYFVLFTW
jgi:hypothetical protein